MQGNKPDFHLAMGGEHSEQFYNQFLLQMKKAYSEEKIKNGVFGAMMQVSQLKNNNTYELYVLTLKSWWNVFCCRLT